MYKYLTTTALISEKNQKFLFSPYQQGKNLPLTGYAIVPLIDYAKNTDFVVSNFTFWYICRQFLPILFPCRQLAVPRRKKKTDEASHFFACAQFYSRSQRSKAMEH